MKRLAYAILSLAFGRFAMANWLTPACLTAASHPCTVSMISRRAPFLGLALTGGLVFALSAILPSSDVRDCFSEAADWLLAAVATLGSLAATAAAGEAMGPWGVIFPVALLVVAPFLIRKGLRVLARY